MGQIVWNDLFHTSTLNVATGNTADSKRMVYNVIKRPNIHGEYNQNVVLAYKATVVSGAPQVAVTIIQAFDSLGEDSGFELVSATLADGTITKVNLYGDSRFYTNSYFIVRFTVSGTGIVQLEGVCGQR